MSQIKGQNKTPDKERNKMDTQNLPDAEFKTLIIRMLDNLSGNFNKEIGSIKMEIENKKEPIRSEEYSN